MSEYSKTQQLRKKPKPKKVNGYKEATEAARDWEGAIECKRCKRLLLDHEAVRHHKTYRSQGGGNEASNIELLCDRCHEREHSHRD